ncbi:hypothetical protein DICVIV_08369 [Dictyocaulus viviparus]|uniref:Uncharacterized protein n=1 Tax=Dictyocaulus viviparus TaxID=29172 RepID=A0A0D8XP71_DICVI|nr:hypothetical protein DICVIV_08369 [Dictyocaulus viviparus]
MPVAKRGLVAPQNTFLENVIRRCNNTDLEQANEHLPSTADDFTDHQFVAIEAHFINLLDLCTLS